MSDHEQCDAVKHLESEVKSMKGNSWKVLSVVVMVVLTFGGCAQSFALYYMSRSSDRFEAQRILIDQNKEAIHKTATRYEKMSGAMEAIADSMKEQRNEQKTLVEAVHRVEVKLVEAVNAKKP